MPQPNETDPEVARKLAHAIWSEDFAAFQPGATPEERRQAWNASRKDFIRLARKVIRRMEKSGIDIARKEAPDAEAEASSPAAPN